MTTTPRRALVAVAALAVAGVALAGCVRIPSAGPRVTEENAVSDEVHALRLEHAGDVVVELGDEPGLTVRAPEATMDRLTIEEEDGTLVLGMRGTSMWSGRITYTLTVRSFDAVEVEGSGDVRLEGTADRGELTVQGSGDIRASELELRDGEALVSGSGDIRVHATDTLDARVEGSGDIVVTGPARVTREVQGSGDIIEG